MKKSIEKIKGEIWKPVPGYGDRYFVSNLGRVKRVGFGMVRCNNYHYSEPDLDITITTDKKGVARCHLIYNGKTHFRRVEFLVATAFIPNPLKHKAVKHIDGDGANNRVENLAWYDSRVDIENMLGEIWKDVVGFEGLYEVSNFGRVRSLDRLVGDRSFRGAIIGLVKNQGYPIVTMSKNGVVYTKKVHQLVCAAFLPNPNNYEDINHKNGVRDDNRVENLEWCTRQYNIWHSYYVNKRKPVGCKPVRCLENNKVYPSCMAAGRDLGIDNSTIGDVAAGVYKQVKGYHFEFI